MLFWYPGLELTHIRNTLTYSSQEPITGRSLANRAVKLGWIWRAASDANSSSGPFWMRSSNDREMRMSSAAVFEVVSSAWEDGLGVFSGLLKYGRRSASDEAESPALLPLSDMMNFSDQFRLRCHGGVDWEDVREGDGEDM